MPVGPKSEKRPADLIGCAIRSARIATGEIEEPLKEKSGRTRSGKAGAKARIAKLTKQQRSEIAKKAAKSRWSNVSHTGGHMVPLKWRKTLSRSDAQQDTQGAKMPFLRFTKGSISGDHTTWFREIFFAEANWRHDTSRQMHSIETAQIKIRVVLDGNDLGERTMKVDHDPTRAGNHNAPTTHLHYDTRTRKALELTDLSGHSVVVERNDSGKYMLTVL